MRIARTCAVLLVAVVPAASAVFGQNRPQLDRISVLNFDEQNHTCGAKGRFQDKEYCDSRLIDQIVTRGKDAVPVLISQLTDTRRTKEPVFDFWDHTTAGDVAFFILKDLFTDSDWQTFNMPGLRALDENCAETEAAEPCWRRLLKKHTRKLVQKKWLHAWNAHKDRVYWDVNARCFRVTPTAAK